MGGADDAMVLDALRRAGVGSGALVGLAVGPGTGVGVATASGSVSFGATPADNADAVARAERELRPRWVVWSSDTALVLARAGVRLATCWDLAAVHRLIFGGWRADPALIWARARGLAVDAIPAAGPVDLFTHHQRDEAAHDPVGADGYLNPDWVGGGWGADPDHLRRWAELACVVAAAQDQRLRALADRPRAPATARAESAAELLCAELSLDGLPMDRGVAEGIIAAVVGPRPRNEAEAAAARARRDAGVLAAAPPGGDVDLRSPGQVKLLLRRAGLDLPDTRAWRLRQLGDVHPVVPALLAWRKAERMATTYGYAWLDEHLAADGRLRGAWSGSDGAAGRMTASAGLHNMPADMRPAVVAEPGHVFVRADLGQIEPRILAAVSRDAALARATQDDDMYAPVAAALAVDRATAKVAVLGAMYGQTTGHGAQALRGLQSSYPVAMRYLEDAAGAASSGRDVRTYGGRLIPMGSPDVAEDRARAAARGRYGRNALVQGAAAELFKTWAVTVRARGGPLGARIVLCLHDELLVHTPAATAEEVAALVGSCLQEAAHRWAPDASVRFVADIGVIARWSDAKQ